MATNPKLKKIDDQIQALRREGVTLYQFGTPRQRAGLLIIGAAAVLGAFAFGAFFF